ncbi:hypothetical protein AaE_002297 [Aphanomyces astaci]|uniref:RNA-directed DNA polymerase n=1 Tax=Aphanomyces astaci TaxID=112090 RepID=A0A6A5AWS7_APHAT|nr:hypothetical protein AaE_002297 [Aphanomyces astaci]
MSDPVGDVGSVELPVPGEGSESSLDEENMDCDEDSPLEEAEYEEVIRVGSMDMPSHEVDTEDDVAGSPVEEGYSHDGSMRTLGRVGYALEVEVGFPTEVIRGEPAVEQAPLESHDQYEKSVVDSVASSEARAVRVDLPVQGAASTAGGYTDLPHSTAVESQVTGPEKLTLPSVNDPSVRWVFTPHQIEAIVRCDFPGIVQGLHSDMEDRMLPLTKADVADQVRKIRDRRKKEIDRRGYATIGNSGGYGRSGQMVASALETCEEARRADRNFNDNRSALVATTRWARFYRKYLHSTEIHGVGPVAESESGRLHLATSEMFEKSVVAAVGCDVRPRKRVNFYGRAEYRFDLLGFTALIPLVDLESTRRPDEVWRLNGHCFAPRRALLELAAGHIVHPAEVTPLRPRELARTPRLPVGSVVADSGQLIGEAEVIHSNPFCDTEPVYEPSPEDEVARSHRNAWRNDSTYQRDLYTVTSVARAHPSRLICHLSNDNAVPLTVVSVNGAKMSALIDTGASVSLLSERCWLSLGAPMIWVQVQNPSEGTIRIGCGSLVGLVATLPHGYADAGAPKPPEPPPDRDLPTQDPSRSSDSVEEGRTVWTQQAHPKVIRPVLMKTPAPTTVLKEIPINWEGSDLSLDQREVLRKELLQFDIFVTTSKAPGRTDLVKCHVNTGDASPIKQAPYRVSQKEGELMEAEIQQYLDLGLIRSSTSPRASPVLMIRKPDGSIRFCIDYRKLNDVTIKDCYPMPRIDDLLDVLGKAKYFSTMDVASGYWNVRMAEDSIAKTAFTCNTPIRTAYGGSPQGVPRGFWNPPSSAQTSLDVPAGRLIQVENVQMSLGQVVRSVLGEVRAEDQTVAERGEVRAFLGLAGYFRRFIKRYAAISRPLERLKTAELFQWDGDYDVALDKLKRALASPPILAYPDFGLPFIVYVDACPIAVGAVLMQKQSGRERVIAYASQALNQTQQRWINKKDGTSEIECFGIVWATSKFRAYLDRRHFTLYTDHVALAWLFKSGSHSTNAKLARWVSHLQSFQFTVTHRLGVNMGCADGLSRLPISAIVAGHADGSGQGLGSMDAWGDGLGTGPMAATVTRRMGRSAAETKDDTTGEGRDPVVSSEATSARSAAIATSVDLLVASVELVRFTSVAEDVDRGTSCPFASLSRISRSMSRKRR